MTLALVRHGRTAWNRDRRMQGRSDVALDAVGREQARAAGQVLARARWGRLVSSPLVRARETADEIGAELGLSVALDDALIERDYGVAEGLPVNEVHERWPDGMYPDAEPIDAVAERAADALRALAREGTAVVVAHGTLLRVGVAALTGTDCPRIANGQIVLIDGERGGFTARFLGG